MNRLPKTLPPFGGRMHVQSPSRFLRVTLFLRVCPRTTTAWNTCGAYVSAADTFKRLPEILCSPSTLDAYLVSLKLNDHFTQAINRPDPAPSLADFLVRETGRYLPDEVFKKVFSESPWTDVLVRGDFPKGLGETIKVLSYDHNPPFKKP